MKYFPNHRSIYKLKIANSHMEKRGQVTIFIIVSLLIVAVILLLYFFLKPVVENMQDQRPKIDSCIEKELQSQISKLGLIGGVRTNFDHAYNGENISILCYSGRYLEPCVVQQPMLKQNFEKELNKNLKTVVEKCYQNSISDLNARGYEVRSGEITSSISLEPGEVKVTILAPTTISNGDSSQSFKKFESKFESDIYEMIMIANAIIQHEVVYGDAEVSQFMFYYPEYIIEKVRRDGGIKVYSISNKKGDLVFKFAARSYAWPPGYG
jgi:hypothetical protein